MTEDLKCIFSILKSVGAALEIRLVPEIILMFLHVGPLLCLYCMRKHTHVCKHVGDALHLLSVTEHSAVWWLKINKSVTLAL